MAVWTPELKEKVIQMYKDAEPTPASSVEVIKDIADEIEQSPNGVRQVLIQAGVYVKKEADSSSKPAAKSASGSKTGEGTKRVSKESQLDALKAAIEAKGAPVDDEIISKLTGKAAAYFVSVLETK